MRDIYLYCEVSSKVGYGHFFRLFSFAQYCKDFNFNPIFINNNFPPLPIQICEKNDFLNIRNLSLFELEKQIIIIDSYQISEKQLTDLKGKNNFLLSIDDLAIMKFPSDFVINPNYGASKADYQTTPNTKYFLSPKYFFLRKEFVEYQKKEISKNVKNVVISLGGSFTTLLEKILLALTNFHNIDFTVISNQNLLNNENPVLQSKNFNLLKPKEDIWENFSKADIAIIAGGLTKYEVAYIGVPAIIFSLIEFLQNLIHKYHNNLKI